jgi:hypothetical protein
MGREEWSNGVVGFRGTGEEWSIGVVEYWSNGARKGFFYLIFQCSVTSDCK